MRRKFSSRHTKFKKKWMLKMCSLRTLRTAAILITKHTRKKNTVNKIIIINLLIYYLLNSALTLLRVRFIPVNTHQVPQNRAFDTENYT